MSLMIKIIVELVLHSQLKTLYYGVRSYLSEKKGKCINTYHGNRLYTLDIKHKCILQPTDTTKELHFVVKLYKYGLLG